MNIIKELLILILFGLMGHVASLIVPLPALILAMLLLFVFLKFHWMKVERIELVSSQLMAISGLFFIPMIVGILEYWENIRADVVAFLLVVTLGTVVPLIVTGVVLEWMINRQDARDANAIKSEDPCVRKD